MNCRILASIATLISLGLASIGCDNGTSVPVADVELPPANVAEAQNAPDSSANSSTIDSASVSREEAQAFADAWVQCIIDGDSTSFNRLVDWDAILGRAVDPFNVTAEFRKGFMSGASKMSTNMLTVLNRSTSNEGSYRLVNILDREGETHCVFRMIDPNSGMNYHDLRLTKDQGQVVAEYFFIALTGEALSDTLRKTVAPVVAQEASMFARLSSESKAAIKNLEIQGKMSTAVQQGQSKQVLDLYEMLPEDVKLEKMPMLFRVMASSEQPEQSYLAAIDEYVRRFPGDASIGLVAIDAAVMRQSSDLLETSFKGLQDWTGGDPYINLGS